MNRSAWLNLIERKKQGKKPRKPPTYKEDITQRRFFAWLKNTYPEVRTLSFHPPNAGKLTAAQRMLAAARGVTAGTPDFICLWPSEGYHGLVAEFKSKKGRITKEQEVFMDWAAHKGFKTAVWYSLEEAQEAMRDYLA